MWNSKIYASCETETVITFKIKKSFHGSFLVDALIGCVSTWLTYMAAPFQLSRWWDKHHVFLEKFIPTHLSKVLDVSFWSKNN